MHSLRNYTLSILDYDQENLEYFLSDFKWSGHSLAYLFADDSSTASHKRKMTFLDAPTGTLLFYYKNVKHEIVHMLHSIGAIWRVEKLGDYHGQQTGFKYDFDSSREKCTFASGLLLC